MRTLIIAEKPSVARDISKVLGRFQNRDGYMENDRYIVSWAVGHLLELAEPEYYDPAFKKWSLDVLPIVPAKFQLRPVKSSQKQLRVLKELINAADVGEVVNACDAGREGELIFRRIYEYSGCRKPVKRLWLSETTPSAIREAFKKLRDDRELDNLALAAEARAEADWLVGINATRAFSVKHKTLLSVGRVQTPTLAILVNREREIRNFKPEPYWEVIATFSTGNSTYEGKWFRDNNNRLNSATEAENVTSKVRGKDGQISSLETTTRRVPPPQFFDLAGLQKEANKRYGLTAQQTLDMAQALYEQHKLITYPRTDSKYITEALAATLDSRLNAVREIVPVPDSVPQLGKRYVDDSKVSDHHAIIPTDIKPDMAKLSDREKKVYDLVVRRFVAAFYPEAVYEDTTVITKVNGETFISKGRVEKERGWKAVIPDAETDGEALPDLAENQRVQVTKVEPVKKETKPPKRYTEAGLINVMENVSRLVEDKADQKALKDAGGIGTPATRAAIIERLIQVGYVKREKRTLVPTEKGEQLIDLVAGQLTSPELTAKWEQRLKNIEQGQEPKSAFMEDIVDFTHHIINGVRTQKTVSIPTKTALGKCPLCGRDVVEGKKGYGCSGWKDGCKFVIWKEIAGKKITETQAKALLTKGKTVRLKGFKSKSGKKFDAALKLSSDGKVEFDFGGRESRGGRKSC